MTGVNNRPLPVVESTPLNYDRNIRPHERWVEGRVSWPTIFLYRVSRPGIARNQPFPPSLAIPGDIEPNEERRQTWKYEVIVCEGKQAHYDWLVASGMTRLPSHVGSEYREVVDQRQAPGA